MCFKKGSIFVMYEFCGNKGFFIGKSKNFCSKNSLSLKVV